MSQESQNIELEQRVRAEMHNFLMRGLHLEEVYRMDIPETGKERTKILDGVRAAIKKLYSASAQSAEGLAERQTAQEKVLKPEEKTELYADLSGRIAKESKRYAGIRWPKVKEALEKADERLRYALFQMYKNGHEVGVFNQQRDGQNGFGFDSCSAGSPANIRDVNYFQAKTIADEWGAPLMTHERFDQLQSAGIIINDGSWDQLYTPNPGTPEDPGCSWFGSRNGSSRNGNADVHGHDGGFRCSLWIPEV